MIKNELNDRLCDALLCLENREECYAFLEDLLTMSEWNAMAQRLEVARQLTGDVTYMDICANTGASTATISRVKKCLYFGAGGYQLVLDRAKEGK